ncbi:unnamed protein product, partial [Discosporangium mesarthrocarpum]
MNTSAVGQAMPPWLHDIFLGYGDPAGAHYHNMPDQVTSRVDFGDTLVDTDHVREVIDRLCWNGTAGSRDGGTLNGKHGGAEPGASSGRELITVTPYTLPNPGPYPQDIPKRNTVRFTPVQVEAIRSGMNPGLTMVVGPPGTG